MINPYVDNLIADKINQNLIRKKIAFIYRIDNDLLNDFFLQSLEHHLYSQSEEPLSSIFFNINTFQVNIEKKEWYLKDQVLTGNFINLKTFELKTEILAKEKQDYLDEVSFCKKKIKEMQQDYLV